MLVCRAAQWLMIVSRRKFSCSKACPSLVDKRHSVFSELMTREAVFELRFSTVDKMRTLNLKLRSVVEHSLGARDAH
jgi:hypothetical protein